MSRPRQYARILPSPTGSRAESFSSQGEQPTSKQTVTPLACLECRARKTKCDGNRPICRNCTKRGIVKCVYLDKNKSGPTAVEWLASLKTLPRNRALLLLNRLRASVELSDILSEFPDPNQAIEELIKPSSLLDAELMTTFPIAYPSSGFVDNSVLAGSHLLQSTATALSPGDRPAHVLIDQDSAVRNFRIPLDPTEAIRYCDRRLSNLQPEFWTDIPVSSEFIARAISLYIRTDHPLLGPFDIDLFITDLVAGHTRFCSPFLFHALMYLACQMYSAFDKNAMQHAEEFGQRAEQLWENEADSTPAMAGAVLLSIAMLGRGRDHNLILVYAQLAVKMGQRLGLFSAQNSKSSAPSFATAEDELASAYGAWGTFNWNVMISQFYRQPNLEVLSVVPTMAIPGEMNRNNQRPGGNVPYEPEHVDRLWSTFPALCQFWLVTHEAQWVHLPMPQAPDPRFRLPLLEHKYRQLLTWTESLPLRLQRTENSPHHTVVFHIWFHTTLLDVLRPFIIRPDGDQPRQLVTFSAEDRSPETAYGASVAQLKRLIFEYRNKYSESTYSILWHSGLIYLANAMIKHTRDPDWRHYLYLCVYGYEKLNRPYRISEVILQGLLAMTLKYTDISAEEAKRLMTELKSRGLGTDNKTLEDRVRATFMVDLDLALTHPDEASVETVAGNFDYLALFQSVIYSDDAVE
ncbi:hypothetical protein F5Y16DRAFT_421912 [Xylariaceae sp. FL0255]|nr:hypothetical protein F5Y16DRAFT_421912 [Xylariaceae sp. FL0255]